MGVIGTGLYDDDTAADVRDSWRDFVASGVEAAEATSRLEAEWATQLADPDVAGPFWLALADTQWKAGQLKKRVLDRAQAVLSGSDELNRWTRRDRVRRQKVLDRLRQQLAKPQRAAQRIKAFQVPMEQTDLVPGEVLSWKLPSGVYVLLWVVTLGDYLGTVPVCALLNWRGKTLPDEDEVRQLHPRRSEDGLVEFFLCKAGPRDRVPAEVVRLGRLRSEVKGRKGQAVMTWKHSLHISSSCSALLEATSLVTAARPSAAQVQSPVQTVCRPRLSEISDDARSDWLEQLNPVRRRSSCCAARRR